MQKDLLHIYKWYQDQTNKKDYITTMTKKRLTKP